jgi:hypothetical protein
MKLSALKKNKKKLKPIWKFSQRGNLWRFFFADKNIIVGETRDIKSKNVYFFSLDVKSGKTFLKNYQLENEDYWISIEGLNENVFFLHRFVKPDLPQHKSIIAVDIFSGKKLWENNEYIYLFNTNNNLYAYKEKFETNEIVEININNGKLLKTFTKGEHKEIYKLKNESLSKSTYERFNYPVPYVKEETPENLIKIFEKEITDFNAKGKIEYIIKGNYLMFNYYLENSILNNDQSRGMIINFVNKFCIYDINDNNKIYKDTLNKNSSYNVPDNFFVKDDHLYYLKEKIELIALNLKHLY